MAFLIDQSDSKYLIMEEEINSMNYVKRIEQISPEFVHQNPFHLNLKRLPKLEKIICCNFSGERYPGILDFNSILDRGSRGDFSLEERFLSERTSEDPAFILYTSGTTAFPKGAMRTQGSSLGIAYYISGGATSK